MFPNQNTSALKSLGVALGILVIAFVVAIALTQTTNTTNSSDIRSKASNAAGQVVDSDALLDVTQQSFTQVNTTETPSAMTNGSDDADVAQMQGL